MTKGPAIPATQTGASSGFITTTWFSRKAGIGTSVFLFRAAAASSRKGQPFRACQTRDGAAITAARASAPQASFRASSLRASVRPMPTTRLTPQKTSAYLISRSRPASPPHGHSQRGSPVRTAWARHAAMAVQSRGSNPVVFSVAPMPMSMGAMVTQRPAKAAATPSPPIWRASRTASQASPPAARARGSRSSQTCSPRANSPAASSGTTGGWST